MDHACAEQVDKAQCSEDGNIVIIERKHGNTLKYRIPVYICGQLQSCNTNQNLQQRVY